MKIEERDKREIIFLLLGHFSLEGSRTLGLRSRRREKFALFFFLSPALLTAQPQRSRGAEVNRFFSIAQSE